MATVQCRSSCWPDRCAFNSAREIGLCPSSCLFTGEEGESKGVNYFIEHKEGIFKTTFILGINGHYNLLIKFQSADSVHLIRYNLYTQQNLCTRQIANALFTNQERPQRVTVSHCLEKWFLTLLRQLWTNRAEFSIKSKIGGEKSL